MIFTIIRKAYNKSVFRLYEHAWLSLTFLVTALFFAGLIGMIAGEEAHIVENYAWWFVVTITTVGYGDYAPATANGRIIASCIMFIGIGTVGVVIGKLAQKIISIANKKAKGLGFMNCSNHTIIMGYRQGNTEKVIRELLANNPDEKIVLCSAEQDINPLMGDGIYFIRGELASADVLERANAMAAAKIIIHGSDDNQTFFTAYSFRAINKSAHMVCYLNNHDHHDKITGMDAKDSSLNQVILPASVYLMAQELQERESSVVVQQLISNLEGENLYRYELPINDGFSCRFEAIFFTMKKQYGATIIAVKDDEMVLNPPLSKVIRAGMAIFYTAPARINGLQLEALSTQNA